MRDPASEEAQGYARRHHDTESSQPGQWEPSGDRGCLCPALEWPELSVAAGGRESYETWTLEKTALTWSPLQMTVAAPEPTGSVFLWPGLS